MEVTPEKFDLRSHDITADKHAALRAAFPEAFTEGGKIDFERLKLALGETIDSGKERYGMTWPGKADCFKTIQQPSMATLVPVRSESESWDTTENLIIEGDNLEVLKLLQKSYLGSVKLIYIDPPYNTGNDFIYPDNYAESLDTYLRYTGQVDSEGRKYATNTEADGRFHSKWLNMMYPRLYLARNLLCEDGVIFISIDDAEVDNLKKVGHEIFGEENYCGMVSRATGTRMGDGDRALANELDYLLVYSKSSEAVFAGLPMTASDMEIYDQEDAKGKYLIRSLRRTGGENRREDRPTMFYPLTAPDGTEIYPIAPAGYESRWVCGKDSYKKLFEDGLIEWKKMPKDGGDKWQVYQKHYLGAAMKQPSNLWNDVAGNKKATKDLNALFGDRKVFDHPKPVDLLKRIISMATSAQKNHIVMDFFGGSGTTGEAVFEQNREDRGNRKFILVQLPEPTDLHGFASISDICKERVRRVSKKLNDEDAGALGLEGGAKPDRGFKVFKLQSSNFKTWNAEVPKDPVALTQQLEMHVRHIVDGRTPEDLLFEILLKSGFPPTTPIETLTLAGKTVFSIAEGTMLICLEKTLTSEVIKEMAACKPERVVCLDEGFAGNDQLKTNAVQTMKTKGVTSFRTV